jgi:hypothetical protein
LAVNKIKEDRKMSSGYGDKVNFALIEPLLGSSYN